MGLTHYAMSGTYFATAFLPSPRFDRIGGPLMYTRPQSVGFPAKAEHFVTKGNSGRDSWLAERNAHGVAMGNAPDELKPIADVVVKHHERDGVAIVLERVLKYIALI